MLKKIIVGLVFVGMTIGTADARTRHHRVIHEPVQSEESSTFSFFSAPGRVMNSATKLLYNHSIAIVSPLVEKANELAGSCGSKVISAVRHTRVRGSGRPSLHNYGQAIDVAGNPSCIYSHLVGWSGGYSVDYNAVNHVHISYAPNGREWGARFQHYGHRSVYPGQHVVHSGGGYRVYRHHHRHA